MAEEILEGTLEPEIDLSRLSMEELAMLGRKIEAETKLKLQQQAEIPAHLRGALLGLKDTSRWQVVLAGGVETYLNTPQPGEDEFTPFNPLRLISNFPFPPRYKLSSFPELTALPSRLPKEQAVLVREWSEWLSSRPETEPVIVVDLGIPVNITDDFQKAVEGFQHDPIYKAIKQGLIGVRLVNQSCYEEILFPKKGRGLEEETETMIQAMLKAIGLYRQNGTPLVDEVVIKSYLSRRALTSGSKRVGFEQAVPPGAAIGIAARVGHTFAEAAADTRGGVGFMFGKSQKHPVTPYDYYPSRGRGDFIEANDGRLGWGIEIPWYGGEHQLTYGDIREKLYHEGAHAAFLGLPPDMVRRHMGKRGWLFKREAPSIEQISEDFATLWSTGKGDKQTRKLAKELDGLIADTLSE